MPGKRALSGGGRAYVGFWFHCSPNPLKRLRSLRGHQLAAQLSDEDRSPSVSLGWVIALFEWACKDFPLAEIRYILSPGFKLPE
ncbi:hypothetical protein DY932_23490 [Pseudomonas paraeruginosa]|uniref:Uncharacterized protein n=1 Tax=Pseudomonas aeruginosa TaxID=287 RepID=A0ABD7JVP4_PSEAI|nr:hypothetical protein DY927_33050 [Pseudomonas aeruginosa]RTR93568.1 hypothetical protein DY932_23490 [Pseudomonas paraeruginosa]RTS40669.1 hypothetical protein DY940_28480 [Pseudomonas aeruginosa]